MKRLMKPEMLEEMKSWGEKLIDINPVSSCSFFRVLVSRFAGGKRKFIKTSEYRFELGDEVSARLCHSWWWKRGGITRLSLEKVEQLKSYDDAFEDPMGTLADYM